MIKINKKIGLNFLIIGIIIVFCSIVFASDFAIMSPYGSNNALIIAPGGEQTIQMFLSNTLKNTDLKVRASLSSGGEVATLVDSNLDYTLPYQQIIPVNIKVKVPEGTPEGTEYSLQFLFTDITPSAEGGMAPLSTASISSFKVLVQKPIIPTPAPTETPQEIGMGWWILGIILVIAVIIIIYYILKSRKK